MPWDPFRVPPLWGYGHSLLSGPEHLTHPLALDMALHVAAGESWLGASEPQPPMPVIFVTRFAQIEAELVPLLAGMDEEKRVRVTAAARRITSVAPEGHGQKTDVLEDASWQQKTLAAVMDGPLELSRIFWVIEPSYFSFSVMSWAKAILSRGGCGQADCACISGAVMVVANEGDMDSLDIEDFELLEVSEIGKGLFRLGWLSTPLGVLGVPRSGSMEIRVEGASAEGELPTLAFRLANAARETATRYDEDPEPSLEGEVPGPPGGGPGDGDGETVGPPAGSSADPPRPPPQPSNRGKGHKRVATVTDEALQTGVLNVIRASSSPATRNSIYQRLRGNGCRVGHDRLEGALRDLVESGQIETYETNKGNRDVPAFRERA